MDERNGAAEWFLHLLKQFVGNPEANENELEFLNRISHVLAHSNSHWQTEQETQRDRQRRGRGLSEAR